MKTIYEYDEVVAETRTDLFEKINAKGGHGWRLVQVLLGDYPPAETAEKYVAIVERKREQPSAAETAEKGK